MRPLIANLLITSDKSVFFKTEMTDELRKYYRQNSKKAMWHDFSGRTAFFIFCFYPYV